LKKQNQIFRTGIDIGSTTIKAVVLTATDDLSFSTYLKHNAEIDRTLQTLLKDIQGKLGNPVLDLCITGSAGMGVCESFGIPFAQEVVAAASMARRFYPQTRMLLDIGGEDSKLVYFNEQMHPDIRMNGSCAGGTGAYIEQIASILHVPIEQIDACAARHQTIYNIACRCGVFAKTDVQNLMSRHVSKEDILASTFYAIAHQTLNTLLQGCEVVPKVLLAGGPLFFFSELRNAFQAVMKLKDGDLFLPRHPLFISALGSAMGTSFDRLTIDARELTGLLRERSKRPTPGQQAHPALFVNREELLRWRNEKQKATVEKIEIKALDQQDVFIGIDGGSTTTKLVVTDEHGRIAFHFYTSNKGDHIGSVKQGLELFAKALQEKGVRVTVKRTAVIGYGEALIKAAYGIDEGFVETIAHYTAAKHFDPAVSFVLDIGGQDMKAIFVKKNTIHRIEINEACSSGCGTFVETFAHSLKYTVSEFAELACQASSPYDLGTRCTVFMNSKVKQALKEGTSIEDIAAGLSYSIVHNCFNKVLKIRDFSELGDPIVVQGGAFLNDAVLRAAERCTGKRITRPDLAELMGAYGAALLAIEQARISELEDAQTQFIGFDALEEIDCLERKSLACKGCSNSCQMTEFRFHHGATYRTGNRCEKVFTSQNADQRGANLWQKKYDLIFERKTKPDTKPLAVIGIPRALNMYENFPFWCTLLVESGMDVVLSSPSTNKTSEYATGSITSENICFPAKLVHGHIKELLERNVDRIFFPMVIYEEKRIDSSDNSYNCPVVAGYPEVIRSTTHFSQQKIPLDSFAVSFKEPKLLKKRCFQYLRQFHVPEKRFHAAFEHALASMVEIRQTMKSLNEETLEKAREDQRQSIMLIGKPYHLDPLVNHNIADIIIRLGFDVLTEDIAEPSEEGMNQYTKAVSQWEYSNRFYNQAKWVRKHKDIHCIQLNSFGCGTDAVDMDEVKSILKEYNKTLLELRVDETTSSGSLELRIRSMTESMKPTEKVITPRPASPLFQTAHHCRTLISANSIPFYIDFVKMFFCAKGYDFQILPMPDRRSVETGLRYVNNDMCYPCIVIIGDIIKALDSGKYDLNDTAVCMNQSCGMCRLTNYTALLKKALIAAGYLNVPVVTLPFGATSQKANEQPGFDKLFSEIKTKFFQAVFFTDQLTKMYYATAVGEREKGTSYKVMKKYIRLAAKDIVAFSSDDALALLSEAVKEFNEIDTEDRVRIKVGIIGEIYAKHNPFGNNDIANWLMEQGVEVIVPPLLPTLMSGFIDVHVNHKTYIEKSSAKTRFLYSFYEKLLDRKIKESNHIMNGFCHHVEPLHTIREIAKKAEKIVSLNMQAGEGWSIPGDVSFLAESGVNHIVCMQPFGCLATHIVGKGMKKEGMRMYPGINILYIDIDPGDSKANIFNRLHIFLQTTTHEPTDKQSPAHPLSGQKSKAHAR